MQRVRRPDRLTLGSARRDVCNAGYGVYGTIDQIAPEQMQAMMDVNYFGTFNAARAALPIFRRQQHGHLVIISSIVGKRGVPYMGAYAATKFAQVGLAECLRAELVGSGIHVSVVYPISTETEFLDVMVRALRVRHTCPRSAPVGGVSGGRHCPGDRTSCTRGVPVSRVEGACGVQFDCARHLRSDCEEVGTEADRLNSVRHGVVRTFRSPLRAGLNGLHYFR